MKIRPFLPAFFLLLVAANAALHGLRAGNLKPNLPGIAIFLLLGGFYGWREWKIATDKHFAEYQAGIDSLPWEEALSAARTFFLFCVAVFVLLMIGASFQPQILRGVNLEAFIILPLAIGPAGAILVGVCRFFWRR